MLHLFASVLNGDDTKSGGGTLEEMTEGGKLLEVLLLSETVSLGDGGWAKEGGTYRAFSMLANVVSAWSKNPPTIPSLNASSSSASSSSSISRIWLKTSRLMNDGPFYWCEVGDVEDGYSGRYCTVG